LCFVCPKESRGEANKSGRGKMAEALDNGLPWYVGRFIP
jgi:hypothetical protein